MFFWAGYDLGDGNWSDREGSLGIQDASSQTRGVAWSIRNIADAASMAPDSFSVEKDYFIEKVNNNLSKWSDVYVNGTWPSNRWIATQPTTLVPEAASQFQPDNVGFTSPWMDDFVLIVWAHMKDCGFNAGPEVDWLGDCVVNRLHNPDFNWYRSSQEWMPVTYKDANDVVHKYPSWAAVSAAYVYPGPTSYVARAADTYQYIARCALSNLTDLPDGQDAWDWYDNILPGKDVFNVNPGWDCVPRGYVPPTDTMAPSAPYNLSVTDATENSLRVRWTAPGDNGLTGTATSYDLRYSTSPITSYNWGSATQVANEPNPAVAGTVQSMVVSGLDSDTTYYFAMTATDEVPNVSAISSVVSGTTLVGVDDTAPAAVNNLAADDVTTTAVTLTWTAPGDDGTTGTASTYDVRYSTSLISAANWDSATQVANEPTPTAAGTSQSITIDGLENGTTYYFAMKTSDEVPNTSALSNVVSATTIAVPPTVQFSVSSLSGSESTTPATITVTLDKPWTQTVVVNYAVTGGTATEGSDFSIPVTGGNVLLALKRDATLTTGGSLASQFAGLTDANVAITPIKDARMSGDNNSRYMNYGTSTLASGNPGIMVLGLDLSGYAGATVNKAQLRSVALQVIPPFSGPASRAATGLKATRMLTTPVLPPQPKGYAGPIPMACSRPQPAHPAGAPVRIRCSAPPAMVLTSTP